jgi:hypothetical protein
MFPLHVGELVSQQDVLVRVDAPHERDIGPIIRVLEDAARQLVARRDALAAGDEGNVSVLVWSPRIPLDGGKGQGVAGLQRVQVGRLLAIGIALYEEFNVAFCVCRRLGFLPTSERATAGQGLRAASHRRQQARPNNGSIPRSLTGVYGRRTGRKLPLGRDTLRRAEVKPRPLLDLGSGSSNRSRLVS